MTRVTRLGGIQTQRPVAISEIAALIDAGRWGRAEKEARRYTKTFPDEAEGWYLLGLSQMGRGHLDQALPFLRKAVGMAPDHLGVQRHLGQCLAGLGRHEEARAAFAEGLRLAPGQAMSWLLALDNAIARGDLEDAERFAREALRLDPDNAFALNNLGRTLLEKGRAAEAIEPLRRVVRLQPGHANAHFNLGWACEEEGLAEEAARQYREAIGIAPDLEDAYLKLGGLLQSELRRAEEALKVYEAALARGLAGAPLLADRGAAFEALGRVDEAAQSFNAALQKDPDCVPALVGLGLIAIHRGVYEEADRYYRHAAVLAPEAPAVLHGLGVVESVLEGPEVSVQLLQRAVAADPDYIPAWNSLLFTLNYHPTLSGEEIFAWYQRFDARFARPLMPDTSAFSAVRSRSRERLRIGYVSADLRRHSVRYFLMPLLANHDRERFEITAYYTHSKEDEWTSAFRGTVDRWVEVASLTDAELAERIRADGIDVLVDLSGHTDGNRLLAFARRPAPVSVSWLGFGTTTGLSAMDWFLTDAVTTPPGSEHLFSEAPWRLPQGSLVYRPDPDYGEPGSLPARERGFVTFASLSRAVRLNHRVISLWARLLKKVPGSRLRIDSSDFRSPRVVERFRERFTREGIPPERLDLGFHEGADSVLREVDICLDCFPHNSGTTLIESLYMGVPFITLASRPPVGRLGASILTSAGRPDWIASSEAEYLDNAAALAGDLDRLAEIRSRLREELSAGPLMDEAGFARRVEGAYQEMWRRARDAGEAVL